MSVQAVVGNVKDAPPEPFNIGLLKIVTEHEIPILVPGNVLFGRLAPEVVHVFERAPVEFLVLFHALDVRDLPILLQMGVVPFWSIVHLMTLLLLFFRRPAGPSQCAACPDIESLGARLTAVRDQAVASPGAGIHEVRYLQRTSGERLGNEPSDHLPATAKDQEANIRAVQSLTVSPPRGGPPKDPIDAEIDRVEWTPIAAQKNYRDFRRV